MDTIKRLTSKHVVPTAQFTAVQELITAVYETPPDKLPKSVANAMSKVLLADRDNKEERLVKYNS